MGIRILSVTPAPSQRLKKRSTTSSMTQTTGSEADERNELLSRYGNTNERQHNNARSEQSSWRNLI